MLKCKNGVLFHEVSPLRSCVQSDAFYEPRVVNNYDLLELAKEIFP